MPSDSVGYEIRERASADGGVVLELVVEGAPIARATASAAILDDLRTERGLGREAALAHLRSALLDALKTQGQFVELRDLREHEGKPLHYSATFVYRLGPEVSTGLVWYDVNTSTTGPDDVPAVVRNKMRNEVHRALTAEGSVARALVDLHE